MTDVRQGHLLNILQTVALAVIGAGLVEHGHMWSAGLCFVGSFFSVTVFAKDKD